MSHPTSSRTASTAENYPSASRTAAASAHGNDPRGTLVHVPEAARRSVLQANPMTTTVSANADDLLDEMFTDFDRSIELGTPFPLRATLEMRSPQLAAAQTATATLPAATSAKDATPSRTQSIPSKDLVAKHLAAKDLTEAALLADPDLQELLELAQPQTADVSDKPAISPLVWVGLLGTLLVMAGLLVYLWRDRLFPTTTPNSTATTESVQNQELLRYAQRSLSRIGTAPNSANAINGTLPIPAPPPPPAALNPISVPANPPSLFTGASPSPAGLPAPTGATSPTLPAPNVISNPTAIPSPANPLSGRSSGNQPRSNQGANSSANSSANSGANQRATSATPRSSSGATTPTPASPAASPQAAVPTEALKLMGLLELGANSSVMVTVDGSPQRFKIGDRIGSGGWVLESVGNQQATIRRGSTVRRIYVGQEF